MIVYRLLRFIEFLFGVVLYGTIGFNDCDLLVRNEIELVNRVIVHLCASYRFWSEALLLWMVVISMPL